MDSIDDEAFNSTTFNDLKEMTINGEFPEETTLSLTNARSLVGLNNFEKLEIKNYVAIHSNASLQGVSHSLCFLSITNIESTLFPRSLFGYITFSKIISLDISWNQLSSTVFNNLTFTGLQESLKRLDMSNSRVTNITASTFENFLSIELINLQNNNIFSLSIGTFANFLLNPQFKVYLGNNPWICDMDICHLIDFVNLEDENVVCNSPQGLLGHPINDTLCVSTTIEILPTSTTTTEGNFDLL